MDGKVPKTIYLCNKKVSKVLNSGTPEVSNHLVRMERRTHARIVLSIIRWIRLQKVVISL